MSIALLPQALLFDSTPSRRLSNNSLSSLHSHSHLHDYGADDLLRETLADQKVDNRRVVEDDLEDIWSMPISQALQSRRPSASNLRAYLPSSSSSVSLNSTPIVAPAGPERSLSFRTSHLPKPTLQISRSPSELSLNVPVPAKKRSISPQLGRKSPTEPPLQKRRNASLGPSGTGRGGATDGGGDGRVGEDWEMLQVAKNGAGSRKAIAGSVPRRSPSTSTAARPFPSSALPSATPIMRTVSSSGNRSNPRVRAQTQRGPRPSLPSSTALSTASPPLPSSSSASPTPSGGASVRKAPAGKARQQPRQRSFSTSAQRSLSPDEADTGPLPPWTSNAPLVFRSESTGRLEATGRPDELVLPAVARKLEAERLARLEEAGLIAHWGKDGAPHGLGVAVPMKGLRGDREATARVGGASDQADRPEVTETEVGGSGGGDIASSSPEHSDSPAPLPPPSPRPTSLSQLPSALPADTALNRRQVGVQPGAQGLVTPSLPLHLSNAGEGQEAKEDDLRSPGCCSCVLM